MSRRKDFSKNRGFQKYADQVLKDTVPKIHDSAYVIAVAPPAGTRADVQQAVEIGFAILMDKPLLVIAPAGRVNSPKLLRIADHVIEGDMETEAGRAAVAAKLKATMNQ